MINSKANSLTLVVPVYNESEVIPIFWDRLQSVIQNCHDIKADFVFINDGSEDSSLSKLLELSKQHPSITVVDLSRNFGKEAALTAGIQISTGQAVIPIDVDLQDPPEIIPRMIERWREGYEVVLARRADRSTDSLAKKLSAHWFYSLHNTIAKPKIPANVGDFRLMDRCVVDALNKLPETQRFMKGLFAWAGFKTTTIDYKRHSRQAGESKFSGWKLWNFALEGITSFSSAPLRIWTYIGMTVSAISFCFAIFLILRVLFYGIDIAGYASLMVTMTFLGGLQLVGIGVLGEYLGRTYLEAKQRPVYIIRKVYYGEFPYGH